MGFLDNLFSKETQAKIGNVAKQMDGVLGKAMDSFSNALDDTVDTVKSAANAQANKPSANTPSSVEARIEAIFASEYSSYEVKKNVSPTTIGGTGDFRPYTYGLYLDGVPKAFIMITDHNKEVLRTFRWSKEQAINSGIPFINFLTQFPNTEEYIKNRLAENIK